MPRRPRTPREVRAAAIRTVFPVGSTLYKPDRCANGYTIRWWHHVVRLIDMNGRTVNEWAVHTDQTQAGVDRAHLLPNGNPVAIADCRLAIAE